MESGKILRRLITTAKKKQELCLVHPYNGVFRHLQHFDELDFFLLSLNFFILISVLKAKSCHPYCELPLYIRSGSIHLPKGF